MRCYPSRVKTVLFLSALGVGFVALVACRRVNSKHEIVFNPPTAPVEPLPADTFAFNHPAADRAHDLFMSMNVSSEEVYRALSLRERYLVDIKSFEAEVMNGGIDQYMTNSSGNHARQCLEALAAIKATKAHSLLRNACDLFPGHMPAPDREVRQQQYREITDGKGSLEDRVAGDIEYELYDLLLKFWDANKQ